MAGGFAVNKEPATDPFATRFADAGFTVVAFDYRHLGESDGTPRLVLSVSDALTDWRAAIRFAPTLPEVDSERVAIWGFSGSGGHVLRLAAEDHKLAAAIAQTPLVNGPAAALPAARYSTPLAQARVMGRGLLDAARGLLGRPPLLVPLVGVKGTVAMLSTPDALEADRALHGSDYPKWQQKVAARSILSVGLYRPARNAAQIRCPLQVLLCEDDRISIPNHAVRVAERVPRSEIARVPGGHYAPFMDSHEDAAAIQLSFLRRHLLAERAGEEADSPAPGATARVR